MSDKAKSEMSALGRAYAEHPASVGIEPRPSALSWHTVSRADMPYGGIFYPDGWVFKCRPAIGREVSDFSTIDADNAISVHDGICGLLKNCLRIEDADGRAINPLSVCEFDKLYFLLYVRFVTFAHPENKMGIECTCGGCGAAFTGDVTHKALTFGTVKDAALKARQSDGSMLIEPKTLKPFSLRPSTLLGAQAYKEYIMAESGAGRKPDHRFGRFYWMFAGKDGIKGALARYTDAMHDPKQTALYTKLEKDASPQLLDAFKFPCPSCATEVRVPISFPGGIAWLFIDTDAIKSELPDFD